MNRGVSTFSFMGYSALCIMLVFAAVAIIQPKPCSPVLGSGVQALKDNLMQLDADLRTIGYFASVEGNITGIRSKLDLAEGAYVSFRCDDTRRLAAEAYTEINSISSYASVTAEHAVQPPGQAESRSIVINYAGDIKISIRNTGNAPIDVGSVSILIDGKEAQCLWDAGVIPPSMVSICTLPETCAGKFVTAAGPDNSDSYKC